LKAILPWRLTNDHTAANLNKLIIELSVISDCQDAFEHGERENGVFYLRPGTTLIRAPCQFDDTQGWTVMQTRVDGSVDFYRDWASYVNGFGVKEGEFWIGMYCSMDIQSILIIVQYD